MAYNFSEERYLIGLEAEVAVKEWFDKMKIKHTWVNEYGDTGNSFDFKATNIDGIEVYIDVKKTLDDVNSEIHIKISNGNASNNAGLYYYNNKADTYFFVNNYCDKCVQVSRDTLVRMIENGQCRKEVYWDNTEWAYIKIKDIEEMTIIPSIPKIFYYKLK